MAKAYADLRPTERLHIGSALHEASHAVTAAVNGARINSVEVLRGGPRTNPDGLTGYCRFTPSERTLRQQDIFAAGTIGELRWHGQRKPSANEVWKAIQTADHIDFRKLSELSALARENPIAAVESALPLIDRCWAAIAQLASKLHFNGPIAHRDVLAALAIPSDADAHRYFAAIRAGAAPGSLSVGRRCF